MKSFTFVRFVFVCKLCCLVAVAHSAAFARQPASTPSVQASDSIPASHVNALKDVQRDSLGGSVDQHSSVKWYSMITNIPGDWMQYSRQKFQLAYVPELVGLSVLTAGLLVTDKATYEVSDRWYKNSRTVSGVSDFWVSLGDGKSQFALGGAFAAYGLMENDDRAVRTGSQIVQAVLTSGSVVQLLKHITGRESPFVRSSPTGTWRFFPNQLDYLKHVPAFDAFPSGHICTAMATVIVIAENYPESTWIRPVGYVVSGLVGVGMVNRGIHWYSDYPLGLAIGYAFGVIAAHPDGLSVSPSGTENSSHVSIAPAVSDKGVGVSAAIAF